MYTDNGWTSPTDAHFDRFYAKEMEPAAVDAQRGPSSPGVSNQFTDDVLKMFAYAAREHAQRYGSTPAQLAKISHKNHVHSIANPRSALRREFSHEQILGSPEVLAPITLLQSAGTGDGAAGAIVCSEAFLIAHPMLRSRAVRIVAQSMTTDLPATLAGRSYISLSGYDMAKRAAEEVFASAQMSPSQALKPS